MLMPVTRMVVLDSDADASDKDIADGDADTSDKDGGADDGGWRLLMPVTKMVVLMMTAIVMLMVLIESDHDVIPVCH